MTNISSIYLSYHIIDCPQVCPFIYFPVCGSDGIDYVSDCELKRAACEGDPELVMAYTGECNPGTTTGKFGLVSPEVWDSIHVFILNMTMCIVFAACDVKTLWPVFTKELVQD